MTDFGPNAPRFLNFNSSTQASRTIPNRSRGRSDPRPPGKQVISPVRDQMAAGHSPFWEDAPEQWDKVTIHGEDIPGICKVDVQLGRKLEVNSPPGSDGARVLDRGYDPARVTVTVRMWTEEQFAAWEKLNLVLVARVDRRPRPVPARATPRAAPHPTGTTPASTTTTASATTTTRQPERRSRRVAMDIAHPALSNLGVRKVYLENIRGLQEAERGVQQAILTFIEYAPPSPGGGRVHPASSGGLASMQTAFDPQQEAAATAPSTEIAVDPAWADYYRRQAARHR